MPFARAGRPGLLGSVARTAAAREAPAPGAQPSAAPPPAAGQELADQLSRLAELRRTGMLTESEFTAAKSRLLM
ncbi:SHOCT domain-containing protein [Pseudarthrobacter sp. 1C304]|uniref:SHOCT domain-containing protein n=1 Tax=Pseudarthrobacter sp. 1C304 TaxID=3457438 RepID=UPI003FD0C0B7